MNVFAGFKNRFNELSQEKTSIWDQRPWWFRGTLIAGGLTSIGMGIAISVASGGTASPLGIGLIVAGVSALAPAAYSQEKVIKRHTLFTIAREMDDCKSEGSRCMQGSRFGDYLRTYLPFSSARSSLHEVEKFYDLANQNIQKPNPNLQQMGVNSNFAAIVKDLYTQEQQNVTNRVAEIKEANTKAKQSSTVPGTSITATICRKFTDLFRSNSGNSR